MTNKDGRPSFEGIGKGGCSFCLTGFAEAGNWLGTTLPPQFWSLPRGSLSQFGISLPPTKFPVTELSTSLILYSVMWHGYIHTEPTEVYCSLENTLPSTEYARCCFTSVFGYEPYPYNMTCRWLSDMSQQLSFHFDHPVHGNC